MSQYKTIYKNLGETPLEALERLREDEGLSQDIPMTYAGRLDPLAEGKLLVLIGDECKNKDKYLGLDKEYEVEILLGVSTDTGDVMGIVNEQAKTAKPDFAVSKIEETLQKFVGMINWTYPAFSSKTVDGKPLFLWSPEGRIGEIEIPTKQSEIYELELLGTTQYGVSELRDVVHQKINSIKPVPKDVVSKRLGADFRREDVLAGWAEFFSNWKEANADVKLAVIKVRCLCSSGTYMRTLARKIGEELNIPALALSIVRTKIVL